MQKKQLFEQIFFFLISS